MRETCHVYNARAALTLETRCERGAERRIECTVLLELALARAGATEPKARFDWDDKERIKVGLEDELPDLLAVVSGWLGEAEFLHHGRTRDKGYRAYRQRDRRVMIESFSAERGRRTVALSPAARLRVASPLFRVLQRLHGGLPNEALLALLQSIYGGASDDRS